MPVSQYDHLSDVASQNFGMRMKGPRQTPSASQGSRLRRAGGACRSGRDDSVDFRSTPGKRLD
jgi:hypothetical protein